MFIEIDIFKNFVISLLFFVLGVQLVYMSEIANLSKLQEMLNPFAVKNIEIKSNKVHLQIPARNKDHALSVESEIKKMFPQLDFVFIFFELETSMLFKKIIGITSGKGGVGKSTVALNLAFALRNLGFKVGILDSDIYGPSIPVLLNCHETPTSLDGRLIKPINTHGLQMLSMGLFLAENQAAIFRGPMLVSAFTQFLQQSDWNCDYLIIDLPPGTGEIHLTCEKIAPTIEMLLVTTPQRIAKSDVMKMIITLKTMNLKILGLVENMVGINCKHCSKFTEFINQSHSLGSETDKTFSNIQTLAQLPLLHDLNHFNEIGYPQDFKPLDLFLDLAKKII